MNAENTDRPAGSSPVPCSAWIRCDEKQPLELESVIVCGRLCGDSGFSWHEGYYARGEWSCVRYQEEFEEVSHWMPGPSSLPNDTNPSAP